MKRVDRENHISLHQQGFLDVFDENEVFEISNDEGESYLSDFSVDSQV